MFAKYFEQRLEYSNVIYSDFVSEEFRALFYAFGSTAISKVHWRILRFTACKYLNIGGLIAHVDVISITATCITFVQLWAHLRNSMLDLSSIEKWSSVDRDKIKKCTTSWPTSTLFSTGLLGVVVLEYFKCAPYGQIVDFICNYWTSNRIALSFSIRGKYLNENFSGQWADLCQQQSG